MHDFKKNITNHIKNKGERFVRKKGDWKVKKILWIFLVLLWGSYCFGGNVVTDAKKQVKKAIDIRKKAQIEEYKWIEEKRKLTQEYEGLVQEIELLKYQNMSLKRQKVSLENSIKRLNEEIKKTGEISQGILPLLNLIYTRLSEFIDIDMPFLKEERKNRMEHLGDILNDDTVSISEKYRKVMEALFIEAEYGRTVGVYRDKINLNGQYITGTIFRLGRISMFFESPDKTKYAVFDVTDSKWKQLKLSQAKDIRTAIEIAKKRRPVELVNLPIGRIGYEN